MTAGPPDIDVVVVTWNGRAMLDSCLAHLARQTAAHRVIVVDNGSTDGTVEHLRQNYPEVELVALPENIGFGRANNVGVEHGSAPYVVLVNNDVDAEPEFLAEAVAPLRADPAIGAVATLTLQPGNGLVDQVGIQLDPGLCAYRRGVNQQPDALALGPLGAPCAGAAAYRREAFEQVGGFPPELFVYSEDLDLGLRIHAAGWQFATAPAARGIHLGGGTTSNHSATTRAYAAFGRGFVLARYRPATARGGLHAVVVELAIVVWGLLRHRTVTPLTGRIRGWRAARKLPERVTVPPELIDGDVTATVALRRLVSGV